MNTSSTRSGTPDAPRAALFSSFFIGGFECSTHRRPDGLRLDLLSSTQHDRFVCEDYARLREAGISTAREGFRWHLIETSPGEFDFSSALPMLRAAREMGIQVIWDLLHFGWPDHVDIWDKSFPQRFAAFALEAARVLEVHGDATPFIAPVNELSFLSFAAGHAGFFHPYAQGRGDEIKAQLVRGVLAASDAVRSVNSSTRLVHLDPIINVEANFAHPEMRLDAEHTRLSQFQVWDMIEGRLHPELGGAPKYLDIIGVNYYAANQWFHHARTMLPSNQRYLPLRFMLREVSERYNRPLFIGETGVEDEGRAAWMRYVCREVREAQKLDVPIHGVTIYPIVNHAGWDDDRHCYNGLWDYADQNGNREAHEPLLREVLNQNDIMKRAALGEDIEENEVDGDIELLNSATLRHVDLITQGRQECE